MKFEKIIKELDEIFPKPKVIEAVWARKSKGWGVVLYAIIEEPSAQHPHFTEIAIEFLQGFGADLRMAMRLVPPWPEVEEARELGGLIEKKLGIPYFHNLTDEPEEDSMRWWELEAQNKDI